MTSKRKRIAPACRTIVADGGCTPVKLTVLDYSRAQPPRMRLWAGIETVRPAEPKPLLILVRRANAVGRP
jgi:hypothetical protein